MGKPATIHDIARAAGVSASTVSRVLNSTVPVAPAKREAVLAAIDKLQFRPSAVAQNLARGRAAAVGVLTQSISSPFYGDLLYGIEHGFAESGYTPIFVSGNWHTEAELAALDVLSNRRVDGLIVLGGRISNEHLRRIARTVPLVVLGRSVDGLEDRCLRVDDEHGSVVATRYLIELGHQHIVHIAGPPTHQDANERKHGFLRTCREAGIDAGPERVLEGDYTEQSGLLAVQTLLSRGTSFSAIFAANDQMAFGARLALYRSGIRVPEDVSLVGFDDQHASKYTTPPLTTMRQPTFVMGQTAAAGMLQLLEGKTFTMPRFAVELVIRESATRRR